jgi:hypothetical protein
MTILGNGRETVWQFTSMMEGGAIDHEKIIGEFGVVNDTVIVRVAQRVDYNLVEDPVRVIAHAPRMTVGGMFEMDDVGAELIGYSMLEGVRFMRNLPATDGQERILVPGREAGERSWRQRLLARKGFSAHLK